MKYLFIIIITLIIFNSCKVSEIQLSKKAVFWGDKKILPGSTLILYPNGSFRYTFIYSLMNVSSKGSWFENEKEIVLNSDITYKNGYLKTDIQKGKTFKDSIRLELMLEKNNSFIEDASMVVNDGEKVNFHQKENAFFYFGKIDSIKIDYFGDEYKYYFTNELKSDVNIYLNPIDINKEYFEEEHWKKTGKNLRSPRGILYKKKGSVP